MPILLDTISVSHSSGRFHRARFCVLVAAALSMPFEAKSPARQTAPPTGADRARQVLREALHAMGGRALLGMKDLSQSFTVTSFMPQGEIKMEMEAIYRPPNKFFQSVKLDFGSVELGFDGAVGWSKNPEGIQTFTKEQLAEVRESNTGNVYFLLRDLEGDAYTFRHLGTERHASGTAEIVEAHHRRSGHTIKLAVDTRTRLIVKRIMPRRTPDGKEDLEDEYFDYRNVSGVMIPFRVVSSMRGTKIAEIVVRTSEINTGVRDGIFKRPSR